MTKNDLDQIEQELREFPSHKLNPKSEETIHHQLMDSVVKFEKQERRANTMKKMIVSVTILAAVAMLVFLELTTDVLNQQMNSGNGGVEPDTEQEQPSETERAAEFNKEKAKEVMQQYKHSFTILIDKAGNDGLITSFESKGDVISHLTESMSRELASLLADSYINEKEGNLYLIAKDGPTWLVDNEPFKLEKVKSDHYKINQERNNELIGHVMMTYHTEVREGEWIVSEVESKQLKQQISIQEKAKAVIEAINSRNMEFLSKNINPQKGLLFSPYVFVNEDAVIFQKEEIETLLDDNREYLWGEYDGSGKPMQLTPNEYSERILFVKPFHQTDQILVDEPKQRGNTKNNIKEVFPQSKVVEFYIPGTEVIGGMDWASLILVFEQDQNGVWKLVAIINDNWTI